MGSILAPAGADHGYLLNERRAGMPIVFIDRPPLFLDADAVLTANEEGAYEGVRHMLRRGHQRLAYLGDLGRIVTARERYAGYLRALSDAGVAVDDRLVRQDLHSPAAAEAAVLELLALPAGTAPTALFTSQNMVTIGAIAGLRRLGCQHRVALVGFDDVLLADLLEPGLTVIAQDATAIGVAASELLFRRMDGDDAPTQRRIIPARLVARGSGEYRRVAQASRRPDGLAGKPF